MDYSKMQFRMVTMNAGQDTVCAIQLNDKHIFSCYSVLPYFSRLQ